jgi:hypothetical protein
MELGKPARCILASQSPQFLHASFIPHAQAQVEKASGANSGGESYVPGEIRMFNFNCVE